MSERPNFYPLLDLDLSEDDWGAIEKRIRDKQLQWARDTSMGSPKVRREAKRNLDLIGEMRRVLADAALRRIETEAARAAAHAARAAEERRLADWIAVLRGTGTCDEAQFQKLIDQFDGIFQAAEIEARLATAGIRRVASAPPPRRQAEAREGLDKVTAATVRRNLELLGLHSLYELLGLPESASLAELGRRAEEIYRENHQLTGAQAAARSELAGVCKTVFADGQGKARYEVSRVAEVLDQIREQIELAAADRVIGHEAMAALVHAAVQRGIAAEAAREAIESYADAKGWAVQREVAEIPVPPAPSAPTPSGAPAAAAPRDAARGSAPWPPAGPPRQAQARPARGAPAPPVDRPAPRAGRRLVPRLLIGSLAAAGLGGSVLLASWLGGLAAGPSLRPSTSAPTATSAASGAAVSPSPAPAGTPPTGGAAVSPGGAPTPAGVPGSSAPASNPAGISPSVLTAAPGTVAAPQPAAGPSPRPGGTSAPSAGSAPAGFPPLALRSDPRSQPSVQSGSVGSGRGPHGEQILSSAAGTSASAPPRITGSQAAGLPQDAVVAVLAEGDPLLAGALEDRLQASLRGAGVNIKPAGLEHRAGGPIDVDASLDALAQGGFEVLVVAQVERVGERELSFYGRKDVARLARLHVIALRTSDRHPLDGGFNDQIEYTTVNAVSQAETAVQAMTPALLRSLRGRAPRP
jgi:hypothetical protein